MANAAAATLDVEAAEQTREQAAAEVESAEAALTAAEADLAERGEEAWTAHEAATKRVTVAKARFRAAMAREKAARGARMAAERADKRAELDALSAELEAFDERDGKEIVYAVVEVVRTMNAVNDRAIRAVDAHQAKIARARELASALGVGVPGSERDVFRLHVATSLAIQKAGLYPASLEAIQWLRVY